MIPYSVDVPMSRMPLANWVLMGITVFVSLHVMFGVVPTAKKRAEKDYDRIHKKFLEAPEGEEDDLLQELAIAAEKSAESAIPPLALRPRQFSFLQLFSYLFVHADLLHLAGNMLFLFLFGNAVNAKLGHGLFLASYFALGALAGLCWLLLGDGRPVIGASGAIMGIAGIFLVLFPKNDVEIFWFVEVAGGFTSLSAGWFILLYLGCDLFNALSNKSGAVAYICHLGGGLGGIALGITLVAKRWIKPTKYEENLLQVLDIHKKRKTAEEILAEDQQKEKRRKKKRTP